MEAPQEKLKGKVLDDVVAMMKNGTLLPPAVVQSVKVRLEEESLEFQSLLEAAVESILGANEVAEAVSHIADAIGDTPTPSLGGPG